MTESEKIAFYNRHKVKIHPAIKTKPESKPLWRRLKKLAEPIINRPEKSHPHHVLQIVAVVFKTPPKYFSVRIGCNFSSIPIRPVRHIRTSPPTQKTKEVRSQMNCQPFPWSSGKKNG